MEYEKGYKERRADYESRCEKVTDNLWFLRDPRGIDLETEVLFNSGGDFRMAAQARKFANAIDETTAWLKQKHSWWKDLMIVAAPLNRYTMGSTVPFLHSVEIDPLKHFDHSQLETCLESLCHEFVHVDQHTKGLFKEEGEMSSTTIYRGREYPNEFTVSKHSDYAELPWEAEAFAYAKKAYPILREHLLQKGIVRYAGPTHEHLEVVS